jgi:lysyl-tRNA synthetase class 1
LLYAIKDEVQLQPKDVFESLYVALLGKPSGPRAGWFLSALDKELLRRRFRQAAGGAGE